MAAEKDLVVEILGTALAVGMIAKDLCAWMYTSTRSAAAKRGLSLPSFPTTKIGEGPRRGFSLPSFSTKKIGEDVSVTKEAQVAANLDLALASRRAQEQVSAAKKKACEEAKAPVQTSTITSVIERAIAAVGRGEDMNLDELVTAVRYVKERGIAKQDDPVIAALLRIVAAQDSHSEETSRDLDFIAGITSEFGAEDINVALQGLLDAIGGADVESTGQIETETASNSPSRTPSKASSSDTASKTPGSEESAEYPPPTYSFVWEHQQEKLGSKDIPNVTPKKEVYKMVGRAGGEQRIAWTPPADEERRTPLDKQSKRI